jgi:hypothetical protein
VNVVYWAQTKLPTITHSLKDIPLMEREEVIELGNKKTIGIVLLVVGVIVSLLFVAADAIGIGDHPGFGYQQVIGTVVAAIVAVIGLVLALRG